MFFAIWATAVKRLFLALSGIVLASGLVQSAIAAPLFKNSPPTQPQVVPSASTRPTIEELEQAIFHQVNEYRASRNLPPLKLDARVSASARKHSQAMADKRVRVGHDGLKGRARAIAFRGVTVRRVSENVAYIFSQNDPAKRALDGWLRSAAHRQAIEERRYSITGVGVAQDSKGATYFTQIYVRKW
jgi:uncharacterized protein YkwD